MVGTACLRTARLVLRPPRDDDAPAIAAAMTPAVSQWVGRWPVPFTVEMARARVAEALESMARGSALICAIEHGGGFAGWIGGGREIDGQEMGREHEAGGARGSFGYWLGEAFRGRALMQEAAPAFVAALRARLALESVEAVCQADNLGSAKVLAACGLRRVGTRMDYAPARARDELVDVWELVWSGPSSGSVAS